MFRNSYQKGYLTVFFSLGSNPLQIWSLQVQNGHAKRVLDDDIKSLVFEILGCNVSTTFISTPKDPKGSLAIKLPYLVLLIKNMRKYFTFEVKILDDAKFHRRFRVSNFQRKTSVKTFCTAMPLGMSAGWNQVHFNLADYTRRAYGTNYLETVRLQIHANVRIRRVYFTDRLYTEDTLPNEYRLIPKPKERKNMKDFKIPQARPPSPAGVEAAATPVEEDTAAASVEEGTASTNVEKGGTAPTNVEKGTEAASAEKGTASTNVEKGGTAPSNVEKGTEAASAEKGTASTNVEKGGRAPSNVEKGTEAASAEKGTTAASVENGTASSNVEKGTASTNVEKGGTASANVEKGTASTNVEKGGTAPSNVEKGTAAVSAEKGTAAASVGNGTASANVEKGRASTNVEKGGTASTNVEKGGTAPTNVEKGTASTNLGKGTAAASVEKGTAATLEVIVEGAGRTSRKSVANDDERVTIITLGIPPEGGKPVLLDFTTTAAGAEVPAEVPGRT